MRKITIISITVLIAALIFPAAGICRDSEKLNLNDATVEQLIKIPGIDEEMAKKIVEYRDENGEYVDIQELLDIEGIDSSTIRLIRPHIMIEKSAACGGC